MKQNENDEQWLDEIRQTMTDYQEELPADGWEKLAAAMEEAAPETVPEGKPQPKLVSMWMQRAAAVVLLGAIGVGGVYYLSEVPEGETTSMLNERVERQNTLEQLEKRAEVDGSAVNTNARKSSEPRRTKPVKVHGSRIQPSSTLGEVIMTGEEETQVTEAENDVLQKEEVGETQRPKELPSEMLLPDALEEEKAVLLAMEATAGRDRTMNRSWNVGLRLGRHDMADLDFGNGGDHVFKVAQDELVNGPNDSTSHSAISQAAARALTRAAQTENKVISSDNHLSWSAGIAVSRQLHERMAFETGLVYSYLSSDVMMSQSGQQHQQLHYLGIPLKLNITLAERTRWLFYTGFGTMIEHSLYGKRGHTNLHLNDWQWSVNGGLGVEYMLTSHMGLYLEPGVNYFFGNGTEVPSLRTESPFSVNLQIGVRLGL